MFAKLLRAVAVEDVGVVVGPVRPHHRSEFAIDPHLPEELRICRSGSIRANPDSREVRLRCARIALALPGAPPAAHDRCCSTMSSARHCQARSRACIGKCADRRVATRVVVADSVFDSEFLRLEEAECGRKQAFREE